MAFFPIEDTPRTDHGTKLLRIAEGLRVAFLAQSGRSAVSGRDLSPRRPRFPASTETEILLRLRDLGHR